MAGVKRKVNSALPDSVSESKSEEYEEDDVTSESRIHHAKLAWRISNASRRAFARSCGEDDVESDANTSCEDSAPTSQSRSDVGSKFTPREKKLLPADSKPETLEEKLTRLEKAMTTKFQSMEAAVTRHKSTEKELMTRLNSIEKKMMPRLNSLEEAISTKSKSTEAATERLKSLEERMTARLESLEEAMR